MNSVKDKLKIILITYNRKKKLQDTLDNILAENSPVRDFDITVLDNASTDGSSEVLEEYCKKYSNLEHIRHRINIGGNANICRAFEYAAACGKEYVWVLCDDDKYDFNNWEEVEKRIYAKDDIICVADYVFPEGQKDNKAYQIFQLTFVPAGIYRTGIITDDVIINMYESIYTMFQQACLSIDTINRGGKITVLSKPIVFNGIDFEDRVEDVSYTRGQSKNGLISKRKQDSFWILGFASIITMLNDKFLQGECMEAAIPYKDMYGDFDNFYRAINYYYVKEGKYSYFYEIYNVLHPHRQKEFDKINELVLNYDIAQIRKMSERLEAKMADMSAKFWFLPCLVSVKKDEKHKIVKVCGIKFKFRRKK